MKDDKKQDRKPIYTRATKEQWEKRERFMDAVLLLAALAVVVTWIFVMTWILRGW